MSKVHLRYKENGKYLSRTIYCVSTIMEALNKFDSKGKNIYGARMYKDNIEHRRIK